MVEESPPNHLAPRIEIREWFDRALNSTDARPSDSAFDRLAREFQIIVNRQNNNRIESKGDAVNFFDLKDVSYQEQLNKKVDIVMEAANHLLACIINLEEYGGYQWEAEGQAISLVDVQIMLGNIGAVPRERPKTPPRASNGRPRQTWHSAGRPIARLIQRAMRDAGYRGKRLSMTDEESVTAQVGAAAVSWAYGIAIEPDGFATAMRFRDRRKKPSILA